MMFARGLVRNPLRLARRARSRFLRQHATSLRRGARVAAYLIALLLAAVWITTALDTVMQPLFDVGRAQVGDILIKLAGTVMSAERILPFAHLLAELKFIVGGLLLMAVIGALIEKLRYGSHDDALFDVALFVAAVASAAGALPGLVYGGVLLQGAVGELILCTAASALAIYGRGYLIGEEIPRPVAAPVGYLPFR